MNHSDFENNILFYLDNELNGSDRVKFESHLNSCEDCQLLFEKIKKTYTCLNSEKQNETDAFFYTRLNQRMENKNAKVTSLPLQWTAIAASFLIMVALGVSAGNFYANQSASSSQTNEMELLADGYFIDYNDFNMEVE